MCPELGRATSAIYKHWSVTHQAIVFAATLQVPRRLIEDDPTLLNLDCLINQHGHRLTDLRHRGNQAFGNLDGL